MGRGRWSQIPEAWRFVEKHAPGALAAWLRDVGEPVELGELAISGSGAVTPGRKPVDVFFIARACRRSYGNDCTRCRALRDGRWVIVRHRGLPVPVEPGPHVDEHY